MNDARVDQIVRAVLYEGYILYPYRPSVKNHQRWTFGGIYPRSYSEAQDGADASMMETQCLVASEGTATAIDVKLRFLHLTARIIEAIDPASVNNEPKCVAVDSMEIDGRRYQSWQEAVEQRVELSAASVSVLLNQPVRMNFAFPAARNIQMLCDLSGRERGRMVRERQPIQGSIELSAEECRPGIYRLRVRATNETPFDIRITPTREHAIMQSLVSSNLVLNVHGGDFVSMTDPPANLGNLAAACHNTGCWPVLIGSPGETDTMLCSPIILPDYPEIAPESPGDLFDGLEIDEILSLRILTLTDEEKRQAAAVDDRAGALLARTEALAREQLMNLHGTMRGLRAAAASTQESHHG